MTICMRIQSYIMSAKEPVYKNLPTLVILVAMLLLTRLIRQD